MEQSTRKTAPVPEGTPSLGELIHAYVRRAIEMAVHEELEAALGAERYARSGVRRGYRNGTRERTLTGPTGPLPLVVPRATLHTDAGPAEWRSALVPRYTRRLPEVNAAVIATYLAGGNQRRIRAALQPLLKGAPLSKSTVSRIVATLKEDLAAWEQRSLSDLDVVYLYLDALVLRVRRDGRVSSVPVLAGVAVLADGQKQLLTLELCQGESYEAWHGCLEALVARGLRTPLLCIIDGNAGLRRAVGTLWPTVAVQRCAVHKLRNLERKAPKHALADLRADYHAIIYAGSAEAARTAWAAFERTWAKRCAAVVTSLREGGDELLTFFTFPKAQWKTLRTTNAIERLNEEFRRRVKTQGALPTDAAAVSLLFGLIASGHVTLRKLDGWRALASVLRQQLKPVA